MSQDHENPDECREAGDFRQDGMGNALNDGGGVGEQGDGRAVDIKRVIEVFHEKTIRIYEKPRVREQYAHEFERFARVMELSKLTREQLKTHRGQDLILKYLDTKGKSSRYTIQSRIKGVWVYGLGLEWPVDLRRDCGRHYCTESIPKAAPADDIIKRWVDCARNEPDLYLKSMVWFQLESGLRLVNQTGQLKIRNVQFEDGRPVAIVAYGSQEEFKSDAAVILWLGSELSEVMSSWLTEYKNIIQCTELPPTALLWPWRSAYHKIPDPMNPQGEQMPEDWWDRFRKKWNLPVIYPKACRSWTKKKLKELHVPKPVRYARHGHKINYNDMDERYGPMNDDELLKLQEEHLPDGLLTAVFAPMVRVVNGVPGELEALWTKYKDNQLGDLEVLTELAALKRRYKDTNRGINQLT